jgi:2-(1,2-epoxy-1,2-dihydrophenyl)acetyl-CoA isomerase
MTGETVTPLSVEREGSILRLVLDQPQSGNCVSLAMARALMMAAIECDEDDSIRCVLLTGRGRMFCVGGDIGEFAAAGTSIGPYLKEITTYLHAAIIRFHHMPKPMVVAVNGAAAGAGFSLAMLGDIVLAGTDARFVAAYGALGYTPDGGLSWMLPRLVGMRRAQEILLTNRPVTADMAVEIGLATRLVPAAELQDAAMRQATELAAAATGAIGRMRHLLDQSHDKSLETQLESEARAIALSARSEHGREGVSAFLARRRPDFKD